MYVLLLIVLALLTLLFISIAEAYRSIPVIELKRRVRNGQKLDKSLYKVAVYERSAQILLWFLAGIASAGFFVLLDRKSPVWVALAGSLALIWLGYVWIPRSSINVVSEYLAQICAKPLGWLLQYVHPGLKRLHRTSRKPAHTGLYEKSDIVRLLVAQQKQADNRIEVFELDLLKHIVGFSDIKVIDAMTPKRKVHAISVNETLGPIVLSELYKTKHSYFPVYEDKPSDIVGILSIYGLSDSKLTTSVKDIINQSIYYVHEDQYLSSVLQVMLKSAQELFIVINSEDDYTGIITARDVLKKLVGETVSDEFDEYDNRELVADKFKTTSEPEIDTEVIE